MIGRNKLGYLLVVACALSYPTASVAEVVVTDRVEVRIHSVEHDRTGGETGFMVSLTPVEPGVVLRGPIELLAFDVNALPCREDPDNAVCDAVAPQRVVAFNVGDGLCVSSTGNCPDGTVAETAVQPFAFINPDHRRFAIGWRAIAPEQPTAVLITNVVTADAGNYPGERVGGWWGLTKHQATQHGVSSDPTDVNEGIGGTTTYIWVRYDEVELSSSTEVVTGVQVRNWPNWDVACPEGWGSGRQQ